MLPNGVPGGPGGPTQRLHVLPQRMLQVCGVRYEAHAEDVLQQPAPAGGQGSVLFEPRAENRARPPGRHVGGHQERAQRAQVDDVRQRPDTRQRQRHVRRRGAQHQAASQRLDAQQPRAVAATGTVHKLVHPGHRLPVRPVRRLGAAHCPRASRHRTPQIVPKQERYPGETHTLLFGECSDPVYNLLLQYYDFGHHTHLSTADIFSTIFQNIRG